MRDKLKGMLIAAAAVVALAAGGVAIAGATGSGDGSDDDAGEAHEQVTDRAAADRAERAALQAAGPGTVTEIERADEGDSGYEVEVRRADGSFVEVSLDRDFGVVSTEADDD